jgi:hypothetical protein
MLCSTVQATDVIFSYGATTTTRTDGGLVAGMTFTAVGQPVTFNSLGFVDVGNDGLAGSYTVGIWDASQNLLASTTVTPSSTPINGFLYGSIPATTIAAGQQFTIGALIPPQPADPWLEVQSVNPSFGFGGGGAGQFITPAVSLTYPSTAAAVPYAVVNASTQSVPEPTTMGVIGLGLLVGVSRRVSRRR